jgi:hypothetical protein
MTNAIEAIREPSPDRQKLHRDLTAKEKNITDPGARAVVNKHRLALLAMDSIEGCGPDYDAAMDVALIDLNEIPKIIFGCDAAFFQVEDYLTTYILGASDDACDDYHAPLDALLAYLAQRKAT